MTSEEDFARALRASAATAPEPPTELFALAAERRGRTRVRRRRAASASALALVAAAGCALALLPDRSPARPAPAATPVGETFMTDTLISLMPADGQVSKASGTSPDELRPALTPMAWLDYDDGNGPATVLVTTDRLPTPLSDGAAALQCPDTLAQPTTTCQLATRPDGSRVVTTTTAPRWEGDDRAWTVTYAAPDGRVVSVTEIGLGFTAHPGTKPAREQPPLTLERLLAMASSDAWRPAFTVLPASTVPPAAPVGGPAVLAALHTALPAGATFDPGTGAQNTPGRVHGTVSYQGLTTPVVVSVEHGWQRGFPADPATRFRNTLGFAASINRTPDGTLTFVQRHLVDGPNGPAHARSTERIAGALLPDDTVVTIKMWTHGSDYQDAISAPALSDEQLVALVAAPSWAHA
ncbi:hypothetical protein ACFYST_02895 [Kitasatospora sp. NPDC004614]|uniref:hypothetical protein n=1 Tax=unclassified Kitasatospora TaxID=2633591 RepID=UPI0036CB97AC